MTSRWNEGPKLTTAEELAQRVLERLLNLGPYLYEDSEMSGLKTYMSEMIAWISEMIAWIASEVGSVDTTLTLGVMAEIGVTIGPWYQHVLSQPSPKGHREVTSSAPGTAVSGS
ncbi:hypothetical protein MPRF_12330 [Mycolicibacterium parafortuitum]|uniref:Uncharacterized protein n=1 Tax=Mycolicibacterium parafortuitum TaxID=39692 RepID=A0A7I7TZA2_MYCPF|nr:hypothetical protein [Mycolicibacterium parafortuitum]BBY74334.1 hypothetical protein MPRF_12330 [Mycolicibacterium parafortuitum]